MRKKRTLNQKQQEVGMRKKRTLNQKQQEIPDDIVYEILARLPVKTLGRFRCVCRSWSSLISSPPFQEENYSWRLSQQDPPRLFVTPIVDSTAGDLHHFETYSKEGTLLVKFSKTVPCPTIYSIQSCKGLVCLCSVDVKINMTYVFLCNPSTQELISLPPFTYDIAESFGFGYAASTGDFKVVKFFTDLRDKTKKRKCEVFTLGTHQWRETRSPPISFVTWSGQPPYHNGAIHLMPQYNYTEDPITAFDIETEEYKTIPLPQYVRKKMIRGFVSFASLKEFAGSLGLVFKPFKQDHLDIWLLKDYANGKWVKQYSISLPSLFPRTSVYPLAIMDNGYILLHFKSKLLYYDPQEKKIMQIIDNIYSAIFYVESLSSLGSR